MDEWAGQAAGLGLDDDQAALLEAMRRSTRPDIRTDLPATRRRLAAPDPPRGAGLAHVDDHVLEGPHGPLRVRRYAASSGPGQPGLVYFHGGGMVLGSVEYADVLCRQLCAESGVTVVSVDYRLAPEHPYPVATDEAYFAIRWVAEHGEHLGIDASRLAVGGDSAGGSLATGAALQVRDRGGPELRLQLLAYPGVERSQDRPSMRRFGDGPAITRQIVDWMKEQYLGVDPSTDTMYGVPALAEDLKDLPEALVVVAAVDPLRDGVEEYAARLFEAGVPTTVMRYPGVVHGFLSHVRRLARADRCVSDMASVLASRLGTPPSGIPGGHRPAGSQRVR